jgi:short-subunit dehydrogenase
MARSLADKVLIITGASSGIGAATALEAARHHMRIVLAARRPDRLEQIAAQVRAAGSQALCVPTDLADPAAIDPLISRTVETFGTVDILLANAGFGHMASYADVASPAEESIEQRMWEVNYFAAQRCIRAVVPIFRAQGSGHIMLCSSVVGVFGLPYYASYAATKAAQHAMLASLALELEPDHIDVTGIFPAGTRTEFFEAVARQSGSDAISENTPAIFMKSADAVARAIVRAMRRPRPEVWPSLPTRLAAGLWTLLPGFRQWCLRFHARRCARTFHRNGSLSPAHPQTPITPGRPSSPPPPDDQSAASSAR